MDKNILLELINKGLSQREIAIRINKSQSTVKYWLKKYNLKTILKSSLKEKYCPKCKKTKDKKDFYNRRNGKGNSVYCKPCSNLQVRERQRQYKQECISYKGGKCVSCGYNKSIGALEFHHKDPSKKDFSISAQHCHSFGEKIKKELDKCILLCANCHREIHESFLLK